MGPSVYPPSPSTAVVIVIAPEPGPPSGPFGPEPEPGSSGVEGGELESRSAIAFHPFVVEPEPNERIAKPVDPGKSRELRAVPHSSERYSSITLME